MTLPVLTDRLMEVLGALAKRTAPRENVGLILPDGRILELPNRSLNPVNGFVVSGGDVRLALEMNGIVATKNEWSATTLWHTHPGGGVGPSRVDMQNKLPEMNHLVITLTDDEVIPSWY
jgi:proteasome lid subunit RPN8/RPN11